MKTDFRDIDNVFKKKLSGFSVPAPVDMWDKIEMELNASAKKSRFIYYNIAAAIAAITIIGSMFLYFTNNNLKTRDVSEKGIAQSEKVIPDIQKDQTVAIENKIVQQNDLKDQEILIPNMNSDKSAIALNDRATKQELRNTNEDKLVFEKIEKLVAFISHLEYKKPAFTIINNNRNRVRSYLKSLPQLNNYYSMTELPDLNESDNDNWAIGGEFTPLYSYRYITHTSENYSKDYYDEVESPILSYTGGLNVQYNAFKRLTIQAGVYYSSIGQSLDYMSVYSNHAYDLVSEEYKDRYLNSYSINNSSGQISFNTKYVIVDDRSARVNNLSDNKSYVDVSNPIFNDMEAELQQSFKYIEVPFLLRFKIIDKTFDVNIVGGIGANFLIGNDVYLKYGSTKESIGKTNGVNSINYNSSVGFGIEYPLMQRLNIRIEPSLKYYLNPVSSGGETQAHPYSFGLYTGINYSF